MLNPVQIKILGSEGERRFVIIEPILENSDGKIEATGSFKIFKDAFGEESALFTEPLEIDETGSSLPDSMNPDYLGLFDVKPDGTWNYHGNILSAAEQQQVAAIIQKSYT